MTGSGKSGEFKETAALRVAATLIQVWRKAVIFTGSQKGAETTDEEPNQ
ncbi:hypothetical protein [Floridanema evergladense]|uniref:Uncharacterized protein n=1 Tax=Floridaenema evergladense BLCC-F167 TaxID=3153639 RepID=A0ABV4WNM4_9CYAN